MSVSRPETLEDMRLYILTRLGQPVINVEIAPIQLDTIIYDTIQEAQRYLYGEGVDLHNTTLQVWAGVSEYFVGDLEIETTYDIELTNGMGGINTLFSPMHMLLYNDWVGMGNYPGGPGAGASMAGAGALTSFEITGEYMEQVNQMFGKQYTVKYNTDRRSLNVLPTPQWDMIATLRLYCRTSAERLYNNPLVKKIAVARAKIQWGLQIGKYTITMPDGSTMNGFEIMNRGYEEEEKAMEDLKWESEPCDFYVM